MSWIQLSCERWCCCTSSFRKQYSSVCVALIKGHEKWLNGKGSKARVSPLMHTLLKRLVYIGNFFEPQMQATNLSQRLKLSAVVHEMINLRMLLQIKIASIQGFKFLRAYLCFPCQSFSERDNHVMTPVRFNMNPTEICGLEVPSRQHPGGSRPFQKICCNLEGLFITWPFFNPVVLIGFNTLSDLSNSNQYNIWFGTIKKTYYINSSKV